MSKQLLSFHNLPNKRWIFIPVNNPNVLYLLEKTTPTNHRITESSNKNRNYCSIWNISKQFANDR